MYTPKQFARQRAAWRAVIQLNVARTIHLIIDALNQVEEGAVDPNGRELPSLDQGIRELKMRVLPLLQIEEQLKKRLGAMSDGEATITPGGHEPAASPTWRRHFGRLLGRNERDDDSIASIDLNDSNDPACVLSLCQDDMRKLWQNPIVRRILKQLDIRLESESGLCVSSLPRARLMNACSRGLLPAS